MERHWSRTLRFRLVLLVLLAVLPAIGLITYTALEQRQREKTDTLDNALTVARQAAREQNLLIENTRQLLISIAQFPAVRAHDVRHCREMLAQLLKPQPYYSNLGVIGPDGRAWCSAAPAAGGTDLNDRRYFRRALATRDFTIGDYQIGRITGRAGINFGYPVIDARGRMISVVFAAIDISWLNQLLSHSELPAGATLTVADRGGTILARYPDPQRWVGRAYPGSPLIHAMMADGNERIFESPGADGATHLYAFTTLGAGAHGSAFLSIEIPEKLAYERADRALRRNIGALAALAALVLAIGWFGGDAFVLRRLNALAQAAERLGKGDLDARTGLPHGPEEIGELAQRFDEMAGALKQREQVLRETNREMRRVNRALKTLSGGNHAMLHATNEAELLEGACRVIVETGGYLLAWVGYAEQDEGKRVRVVASAGNDGGYIARLDLTWDDTERGRGPSGTAIRTGEPAVVRDVDTDRSFAPWRAAARERGYASTLALPLRIEGTVCGMLAIYAAEPDAFDDQELSLLTEMAADLGYGVTMLRVQKKHREAEDKIRQMAYYDPLTDLPTHLHLRERMQQAVADAEARQQSLAVLAVDINRFKEINDVLGFEQGDALLQQVGPRLRDAVGREGITARLHGDTFGILIAGGNAEQAERVARRIVAAMRAPFELGEFPLDVSVSVGIVLYPAHGARADQLLRRADLALNQGKKTGQNPAFYSPEQDDGGPRRLTLAAELRQAIERGAIELHFQPKIDIGTGEVCGVEALARWNHPKHGMVPPDEFIRLAEHTGLIRPLTEWIIEAAMRQSHAWRGTGRTLPVAVNLSVRNLHEPRLVERIQGLIAAWDIHPGALEIEITESAIMEDPVHTREVLTALRGLGIPLFVDDYGTGYSSLSYLKRLPLNAIKIDKSFVSDLESDRGSELIVRSTIELAHDLGLKVVAEGVETAAMLGRLRDLGCDVAQGYFISKAMPAQELLTWLDDTRRAVAGRS